MAEPQYAEWKGRSGDRLYVCVPIPKNVQEQFGGRKTLERALKTSDPREARRRKHTVVAEFLDRIERARLGGDAFDSRCADELDQVARIVTRDSTVRSASSRPTQTNTSKALYA